MSLDGADRLGAHKRSAGWATGIVQRRWNQGPGGKAIRTAEQEKPADRKEFRWSEVIVRYVDGAVVTTEAREWSSTVPASAAGPQPAS